MRGATSGVGASMITFRMTLRMITSGTRLSVPAPTGAAAVCTAKPAAGVKKLTAATIHAHTRSRDFDERSGRLRDSVVIALIEFVLFVL